MYRPDPLPHFGCKQAQAPEGNAGKVVALGDVYFG
jgi:hypothetical protein